MVGFVLWIISCLGVILWQIGVIFVDVMVSQWTTSFFTVLLHITYGLLCFKISKFIGLCQDQWWDYYFVSINGLGIYFEYLEFDSRLLDVDCLVGTKSSFL